MRPGQRSNLNLFIITVCSSEGLTTHKEILNNDYNLTLAVSIKINHIRFKQFSLGFSSER